MNLTQREKDFILDTFASVHCECEINIIRLRETFCGDAEKDSCISRMIDYYSDRISFVLKLAEKFYDQEDKQ